MGRGCAYAEHLLLAWSEDNPHFNGKQDKY